MLPNPKKRKSQLNHDFLFSPVIIFIAFLSLFIVAWLVICLSPSRVKHMFFPSIFIENDGVTRSIFELIGSNYEIQIKVHTIILLK